MGKTAIRDAYGKALKALGEINDRVVALEADVGGSSKSVVFGKAFPERYFEAGISEINMVNMSAGMAREGLIPFVNTFTAFLAGRGADPIQSLIAYDRMNVKLAGTYCGMSDSYDGASHHGISDMALMRAVPDMVVITPSDAEQTKQAVFAAADYDGPVYLRLSRAPVEDVYGEDLKFEIGRGIVVREGSDLTIVSTGTILSRVLKAADRLKEQGISAEVIDMHTVKPLDEKLLLESAGKTGAVLTVEEDSIYGGLCSAVSEVLSKNKPTLTDGIGITEFAESGDYDALLDKYGFSVENIASRAKQLADRKGN